MSDPRTILASTQRRLVDLRTLQLPRLATCRGPLDLHRELAEEMRGDLEHVRRNIELAGELGESLGNSAEREGTIQLCAQLDEELYTLRMAYRQALVASKKKIASNARRRHEFLESERGKLNGDEEGDGPGERVAKRFVKEEKVDMGDDDPLLTTSSDLTSALLRTTNLLQIELDKSVLSVQTLQQSTQTLRLTNSLYDNYTALLHTSGQIVRSLERADWWDRAVIAAAFLLFLCVVGWVIKRRVLDRVVGGVLGVGGWWVKGSWRLIRVLGGGVGGGAKGVGKVGVGLGKVGVGLGKASFRVGKAGAGVGKQLGGAAGMAGTIAGAGTVAKGLKEIGEDGADRMLQVNQEDSGGILDQILPPATGSALGEGAVQESRRLDRDTYPDDAGQTADTTGAEDTVVDRLLRPVSVRGEGIHRSSGAEDGDDDDRIGSRGPVPLKIRDRDEL